MLDTLTQAFQARTTGSASLGGLIKFDLGEEGVIVLDGSSSPTRVHNQDLQAPCTVMVAGEDLAQILEGSLDASAAFMMGRLTVEGDMSLAMKLVGLLRR
jgi:putative sterol carrier protein